MRFRWLLFLTPLIPLAIALGILVSRSDLAAGEFKQADAATRREAIGDVTDLPPLLRRAFTDETGFAPTPVPRARDWLANQPEVGQTWQQYLAAKPNLPRGERKVIYLQPLGEFTEAQQAVLEDLRRYSQIFFGLEVKLKPIRSLAKLKVTQRKNPHSGQRQYLAGDVMRCLRQRLPGDAYCLLGITMADLYPDPDWNFVFGMASLRDRTGIYSLARYDNRFYDETAAATDPATFLLRCLKVLAHETGHMFGIKHEIFYHCLMCGSNHLGETDATPIHLSPLNLRKLHHAVGFDVVERYQKLLEFYREKGLEAEAEWVVERVGAITAE